MSGVFSCAFDSDASAEKVNTKIDFITLDEGFRVRRLLLVRMFILYYFFDKLSAQFINIGQRRFTQ